MGKPGAGRWTAGDGGVIGIDGGTAVVLEIQPAVPGGPTLFNAPGKATIDVGAPLRITDARGAYGASVDLFVEAPAGTAPASASVNGRPAAIISTIAGVTVRATFDGVAFGQYQPVVEPAPDFAGGTLKGQFSIPRRIVEQLAARRKAWPIPWTPEDFRTTWLVPERLLLFVQIAKTVYAALGRTTDHRRPHESSCGS